MTSNAGDPTEQIPAPPEAEAPANGRRWWERKRILLPAVGFVALLFGVAIGASGADPTELQEARASADAAEERLAEESTEAEAEVANLEAALAEREDDIADLEQSLEEALDEARAELEHEREARLLEVEEERETVLAELEDRAAELDDRDAALEERTAALDERESDLDDAEERRAASTFGNGIHVVGEDIEPGTYRTQGGSNCYWARLSGLGGGLEDIIANGLPDGPAAVEIRSSDAAFESSGCSEWTRG